MARRRLIYAVGVVLIAAAVLSSTIDWRFWYRWYTLPDDPGEWPASYYKPVAVVPGDPKAFLPAADSGRRSIDKDALEAAAKWAEEHNSAALLVLHNATVQLERYWQGIGPDSLFSGRAMTRSLIPPLIAHALADGAIKSLDDRVGLYLAEWEDDPRGQITIRQLLSNISGLENPALGGDPNPFNKNARLSLGSDFRAAALDFQLAHPPGTFFALSNANAQLLGAILESATGENYETFLDTRLWAPLGAGPATLYFDRPGGMPAVYCCFRATPRDWLRFGYALLKDGQIDGRALWPAGWVKQMTTPSAVNPNYGYQVWVGNPAGPLRPYIQDGDRGAPHGEPVAAEHVFFLEGGGYRTMYILPDQQLVILRLGYFHPDWQTSTLPNLILRGLAAAE